jgi:hypothetical protein
MSLNKPPQSSGFKDDFWIFFGECHVYDTSSCRALQDPGECSKEINRFLGKASRCQVFTFDNYKVILYLKEHVSGRFARAITGFDFIATKTETIDECGRGDVM